MTLTEFLLARIAEDEEVAQIKKAQWGGHWERGDSPRVIGTIDPNRVLAECEAKRRIVEMGTFDDSPESAVDFWLKEGKGRTPPQPVGALIGVFRALAAVYSDHPDYDRDWRP